MSSPETGSINFTGGVNSVLRISSAGDTDLQFRTGDFTIEWFQYATGQNAWPRIFQVGSPRDADTQIGVSIEGGTSSATFYYWNRTSPIVIASLTPNTQLINKWVHFAISRASGSLRVFMNGLQIGSTQSVTTDYYNNTKQLAIGNEYPNTFGVGTAYTGRISNFRIVKGTALYTSNFYVPSAPLTDVSGTRLLLLAGPSVGSVIDSSSYNKSITASDVTLSNDVPYIPGSTPMSLDSSGQTINVYKHLYNPGNTKQLSVTAVGGSGSYTYTWTGGISSGSTANIIFKTGISSETINVNVSDGTAQLSKAFYINYVVPPVVNPANTDKPSAGAYYQTADGKLISSVTTGLGKFIGTRATMSAYTPPVGQGVNKLAGKIIETAIGNNMNIVFDIDKYDGSNNVILSSIDSNSTFGTIQFDISEAYSLVLSWKNGVTGVIYKTAEYNSSNNTINTFFTGISLTRTNSGGRNYFTYVGPNSQTTVLSYTNASTIPCFVEGTRIVTPVGERAVETLKNGDIIMTADGRKVPVTIYSTRIKETTETTAPYLIPADAFGSHMPPRDIMLSPKHAIQIRKNVWEIPQFAAERYHSIKKTRIGESVAYYHIELPNYFTDNIIANGAVCESLGVKAAKLLPKGKALYTFSKKTNGFIRHTPDDSKKKTK